MAESTPRAQLAAGPDWVAAAACLALLLLMIFPAVSGAIAGLLALAGLVAALRGARPGPSERQFATLCLLLPAAYVFNMVLKGWQSNLLDRPMHLAYAVLLAMLISRRGLEMRTVFVATVAAALVAGAVALWRRGNRKNAGLMALLAAVMFVNVAIWLLPTADGETLADAAAGNAE